MSTTFGKRSLGGTTGHGWGCLAEGKFVAKPVGVTIDWDSVEATEDDVTLADGTVVAAGKKYLRYGQVLVFNSGTGKWTPWTDETMVRGEVCILDRTVILGSVVDGLYFGADDHASVFEGGRVYKDRLLVDAGPGAGSGLQKISLTVLGTITASGNAEAVVTANGLAGSPLSVIFAVLEGTAQVETNTVVGDIGAAGAGDVEVIITAAGLAGSPKTYTVAVANNDTAAQVATKIRAELNADNDLTDLFTVGGAGADIVLTCASPYRANDATLNISIDNGTTTDLTPDLSSTNTTAGVAADGPSAVATKLKAALNGESDITDLFAVGGTGANVTLQKLAEAPEDATLGMTLDDDTSTGLTLATSTEVAGGLGADTGPNLADLEAVLPLLNYA